MDLDLEKFFDRVNHDVLMSRLARRISDKRVLRLIRRYLQAGMMTGGVVSPASGGNPARRPALTVAVEYPARRIGQGTGTTRSQVLPLCRRLQHLCAVAGGRRASDGVSDQVPVQRLRLKVNAEKSAVARPWERKFLGYSMTWHKQPRLKVAPESVRRLKAKVRTIIREGRGRSLRK